MSQEDIMNFLDKHPGKFYSARQIKKNMKVELSIFTIWKSLSKIIKREEYKAKIRPGKRGSFVTHYGMNHRRTENGTRKRPVKSGQKEKVCRRANT